MPPATVPPTVNIAPSATFGESAYTPPQAAIAARRILVKPNLGYPVPAPVTTSVGVLAAVLRGLRRVNPTAEILIVEGVCSPVSLSEIAARLGVWDILDGGMQLLDADTLPLAEYANRSPHPVRFARLFAPALLREVDCRLTVSAFKRTQLKDTPLISASLKNLYGLLPRSRYRARSPHARGQLHRPSVPAVLQDVYFCLGYWFEGAVVDGDRRFVSRDWHPDKGESLPFGQIVWGDDPIAVDRAACAAAGEPIPSYVEAIEHLRSQMPADWRSLKL